jgi:hypothetical protein
MLIVLEQAWMSPGEVVRRCRWLPARRRDRPRTAKRCRVAGDRMTESVGKAVLMRRCLDQQVPEPGHAARHNPAMGTERNDRQETVAWRFTVRDARNKVTRLYPHNHVG